MDNASQLITDLATEINKANEHAEKLSNKLALTGTNHQMDYSEIKNNLSFVLRHIRTLKAIINNNYYHELDKWIPITDQQPPFNARVQFFSTNEGRQIGYLKQKVESQHGTQYYFYCYAKPDEKIKTVTHWRPILGIPFNTLEPQK